MILHRRDRRPLQFWLLGRGFLCGTAALVLFSSIAALILGSEYSTLIESLSTTTQAMVGKARSESHGKLRLLCLHGYRQDASAFRSKIGSLRKALKTKAEFVFLDGPYRSESTSNIEDIEGRAWWKWCDMTKDGVCIPSMAHYFGWEASSSAIKAAIRDNWPVDGILGFSQGATAAAIYLAQARSLSNDQSHTVQPLRFAIFISGYLPRDQRYAADIERAPRLDLPTLHVIGRNDDVVTHDRSKALYEHFSNATVFVHEGGHMVPTCSGDWKRMLTTFLDEQRT